MKKIFHLALDLKDDPQIIAEYEAHHTKVWPEIIQSIKEAGVTRMDIFRFSNRLFMIMETNADFSFDKKTGLDSANPMVQKWEELMSTYQQELPGSNGNKWQLMHQIFAL